MTMSDSALTRLDGVIEQLQDIIHPDLLRQLEDIATQARDENTARSEQDRRTEREAARSTNSGRTGEMAPLPATGRDSFVAAGFEVR